MRKVRVRGTGMYLPGEPITNEKLKAMVPDLDEMLIESVGISRRYWAVDFETGEVRETGATMAAKAAASALQDAGLRPADIDLLILATSIPDHVIPQTVVFVQEHLGIDACAAIEIHAGCVGAIQALSVAETYLRIGQYRTAVVCCSQLVSPFHIRELKDENSRLTDRLNAVMFGDGASAVVLTADAEEDGILATVQNSVGVGLKPGMMLEAGGAITPASLTAIERGQHRWRHDAKLIRKHGSDLSRRAVMDLVQRLGLGWTDVRHYIFPQANPAMIAADQEQLRAVGDFPVDRMYVTVDRVGNTGVAALFMAVDELNRAGHLNRGDLLMVIGGEASKWLYAGTVIRWSK